MPNSQFEFTAVKDEDKADRYDSKLEELAAAVEDPDPNKLDEDGNHPVAEKIENTMDSVEEIITTLQEDEAISEQEINTIRQNVTTFDEIEKTGEAGYHLTIREIKDEYKDLHEKNDARIREWKSYLVELSELKDTLYQNLADQLNEERVNGMAVDRLQDFMSDQSQEHLEILTDRFESLKDGLEGRVETEVQGELADLQQRVTRLETEQKFRQEQFEQAMEIIADLTAELDRQGSEPSPQVREKARDLHNDVHTDLDETAEQVAIDTQTESPSRRPQDSQGQHGQNGQNAMHEKRAKTANDGNDAVSEHPGQNGGNLFEDVDTADTSDDDGPLYEFYEKSPAEAKPVFEQIEANEDTENMSFRDVAAKSDVSHETIRNKCRQVKEQYGDDITELGR